MKGINRIAVMKSVLGFTFFCATVGPLSGAAPFMIVSLPILFSIPVIIIFAYQWAMPAALVFALVCAPQIWRTNRVGFGMQGIATVCSAFVLLASVQLTSSRMDYDAAIKELAASLASGFFWGCLGQALILSFLGGAASLGLARRAGVIDVERSAPSNDDLAQTSSGLSP